MSDQPARISRDIRRAPPWRVGLVFGAVIAGLLSLSSSAFPSAAAPSVSESLYHIARSTVEGGLVGGVYGLILGWLGSGRLRSHLGAGPVAVLTWLVATVVLEGHSLGGLVTPLGAGIVVLGGLLFGAGVWLCLWVERAGDAA